MLVSRVKPAYRANARFQLTASPVSISPTEGTAFSGSVATVADVVPSDVASTLTALIDWGDGRLLTGNSLPAAQALSSVIGNHTYALGGKRYKLR